MVLLLPLPAECSTNRLEATQRGVSLEEVERDRLGVTHADVGAYLLGLWGLPHEIIEAVAHHHSGWEDVCALDTSSAVRIADALVSELTATRDSPGRPPPRALLDRLGVAAAVDKVKAEIGAALGGGS